MVTHNPYNLPDNKSSYGYRPTTWITIVFLSLFGLTTGWVGRAWSANNLWLGTPFMIQISCLIIAPTFLSTANFILLGHIIAIIGPQYSIMSARLFGRVFVTADVLSLLIQAAGGGIASSAKTHNGAEMGAKIMLVGIITQFISMIIYSILGIDFVRRVMSDKSTRSAVYSTIELNPALPADSSSEIYSLNNAKWKRGPIMVPQKLKLMGFGLAFSTVLLLIRGVYRIIELSDGWSGTIIHTQAYFNVFDGMMIALAMFTLNVFHPGWLMPPT